MTTLLNRFRVEQLIKLSAAERTLTGAERIVRESEVATLIKAAYDEASDEARAAFMARVKPMPVTAWPWTAVQAQAQVITPPGQGKFNIAITPDPSKPGPVPALMLLLRGQVSSADKSPGNEIPTRGTPEAELWEPLYRALDRWDTPTITRWIGPQGWSSGTQSQAPAAEPGNPTPAPYEPPLWKNKAVIGSLIVVSGVVTLSTIVALVRSGSATRRLEEQLRSVREER